MSNLEHIEIIQPQDSPHIFPYAKQAQRLFKNVFQELYVDRLGLRMNMAAAGVDPDDPQAVNGQLQRFRQAGGLERVGELSYRLAVDRRLEARQDLIGVLRMTRLDEGTVELQEIDVLRSYRGIGVGRLLLAHGLQTRHVDNDEQLRLHYHHLNAGARDRYLKWGFRPIDDPLEHPDVFPDDPLFNAMAGRVSIIRHRLTQKPPTGLV